MKITDPELWCQYQEHIVDIESDLDSGKLNVAQASDQVGLIRGLQMRLEEGGPQIRVKSRELEEA